MTGQDRTMEVHAMPRLHDTGTRASNGFTLVELLVVMGIIGLLIALLLPAVDKAVRATRNGASKVIIQSLSVGLEAFKADWGAYPPSDRSSTEWGTPPPSYVNIGGELMAYALMGPGGNGWGVKAAEAGTGTSDWILPFGGEARKAYGPYFTQESGDPTAVHDGFPSYGAGGIVLYYRFDAGASSGAGGLYGDYDYADNPTGDTDWRDGAGFKDRTHFRLSTVYEALDRIPRWQREDYLLISPGADRLYGHVYLNPSNPDLIKAATASDISAGRVAYDDITNF